MEVNRASIEKQSKAIASMCRVVMSMAEEFKESRKSTALLTLEMRKLTGLLSAPQQQRAPSLGHTQVETLLQNLVAPSSPAGAVMAAPPSSPAGAVRAERRVARPPEKQLERSSTWSSQAVRSSLSVSRPDTATGASGSSTRSLSQNEEEGAHAVQGRPDAESAPEQDLSALMSRLQWRDGRLWDPKHNYFLSVEGRALRETGFWGETERPL